MFNVKGFVEEQCEKIKETIGNEKALIAVSGGVDSTTCAVLTHKTMGNKLQCVFIDTGFMRLNEPEKIKKFFQSLKLPFKIINARSPFLEKVKGLKDAEIKRKKFREVFYEVLSKAAKKENCKFLVQGTIAPDWIETKGGIKTQHNVLSQVGINPKERFGFKVIEPLAYLYKDQVREVARYLKVKEMAERQPFPGPGLLIRVIGKINEEKLEIEKRATEVVEDELEGSQYFVAIMDDEEEKCKHSIKKIVSDFLEVKPDQVKVKVPKSKVTGVKGDLRAYKKLVTLRVESKTGILKPRIKKLVELQENIISENPEFTRVAYSITEKPRRRKYIMLVRSVKTRDFMTAEVTPLSWKKLTRTANEIMKISDKISEVYYDVTPKPPATVEYE